MSVVPRPFFDKERAFALLASAAVHVGIMSILIASFPEVRRIVPKKEEFLKVFSIDAFKDRFQEEAPQIAPPKVDAPGRKSVKKPEEMKPKPIFQGGAPGELMIWTPPPPKVESSSFLEKSDGSEESRVLIPDVVLRKGASEAVLLSFDQGRFADPDALKEADRIGAAGGGGTIVMSASVNDMGQVVDCSVRVGSGSDILDAKACGVVRSYKYRPAQDGAGNAFASQVTETLEWSRDGAVADTRNASVSDVSPIVMPGQQAGAASNQHLP